METVICLAGSLSVGDPGPTTIAVRILTKDDEILEEFQQEIGNCGKNYAAYQAVFVGLQRLLDLYGATTETTAFTVKLPNELVKKQLNNEVIVAEPSLVPFFMAIHNLQVESFPHLTYALCTEAENQSLASLLTKGLDQK